MRFDEVQDDPRAGEVHALEEPAIQTRHPREDDLDALVAIDREWTGAERRPFLAMRLQRALRPGGISLARVATATAGDETLGFLFGEVTHGQFGRVAPVAWIDTVGVRRDVTHRGVGTLLLKDFMRHARLLGVDRVRTMLEPADGSLAGFLLAMRFHDAPTRVVERALELEGERP